jgi:hypothetical protein
MGAASGTVTLLRTVGGSLGIAVLGTLYAARMRTHLTTRLGPGQAERLERGGELTPGSLPHLPVPVADAVREAVTSGLHALLIGAAVLAATSFAIAWLIREIPLRTETPPRPDPEPTPQPDPEPAPQPNLKAAPQPNHQPAPQPAPEAAPSPRKG